MENTLSLEEIIESGKELVKEGTAPKANASSLIIAGLFTANSEEEFATFMETLEAEVISAGQD